MINFTCPNCTNAYGLPDSRRGQTFRCPHCYELQTVPATVERPRSSWLPKWLGWPTGVAGRRMAMVAALMLIVPVGGPLVVWLGLGGGRSQATATSKADAAFDALAKSASADKQDEAEWTGSMGGPELPLPPVTTKSDTRPAGPWTGIFNSLKAPPNFIDPDVHDRLSILYRMLQAYNHRGPYERLDGPSRARTRQHLYTDNDASKIPTAEELRDWFTLLTSHQRIELSSMFRDRQKLADIVKETVDRSAASRARGERLGPTNAPMGGRWTKAFVDPFDVFVSPRDGKPFVIDYRRVPMPPENNKLDMHDSRAIIYEQDGVDTIDLKFMEHRRERKFMSMSGQYDRFFMPANAPEVP